MKHPVIQGENQFETLNGGTFIFVQDVYCANR